MGTSQICVLLNISLWCTFLHVAKPVEVVIPPLKKEKDIMKVVKEEKKTKVVKRGGNGKVKEIMKNTNLVEKIVAKKICVEGKVVCNEGRKQIVLNKTVSNEVDEKSYIMNNQYLWENDIINANNKVSNVMVSLYVQIIYSIILETLITFNFVHLKIFATFF